MLFFQAGDPGGLLDAQLFPPHAAEEGQAEEVGDLLFSLVNLSRHLKLDAESALRHASHKFERRFEAMESVAAGEDTDLADLDQDQLEALWQRAKSP